MLHKSLLILFLGLSACSVSQFNPLQTKRDFITIGFGGGFAGIETQYHILDNGKVYEQVGLDSSLTLVKTMKKETVEQAIQNCHQFNLTEYQYQNPGNTYKFLTIHHQGESNRIVWGGKSVKEVRPVCTQIHDLLYGIITHANDAKK